MRPRELPADLDDLQGGLSLGQHDLGKPDAAHPIEVEREVRLHARIIPAVKRKT
jgi:hypothetical protein